MMAIDFWLTSVAANESVERAKNGLLGRNPLEMVRLQSVVVTGERSVTEYFDTP